MVTWQRVTTLKRRGDRVVQQHRVLAMDLEHPAAIGHHPHGVEERLVGQAEVEDHERLRRRDPAIDRRRQL